MIFFALKQFKYYSSLFVTLKSVPLITPTVLHHTLTKLNVESWNSLSELHLQSFFKNLQYITNFRKGLKLNKMFINVHIYIYSVIKT